MAEASIQLSAETVSSHDRSFLYGDGCFTTILCSHQKAILLREHIKRLERAAQVLGISVTNWRELEQNLYKIASEQSNECVIRVLLSRGDGGRGYQVPSTVNAKFFISLHSTPQSKVSLNLAIAKTRLSSQPLLAGLKHNNRLEQILAKQELLDSSELKDDLIMLDMNDNMIESTSANILYYANSQWFTPLLDEQGVEGVMRNFIMGVLAAQGVQVTVTKHSIDFLANVESMILCNSIRIIEPVAEIVCNGQTFTLDQTPAHKLKDQIKDALLK